MWESEEACKRLGDMLSPIFEEVGIDDPLSFIPLTRLFRLDAYDVRATERPLAGPVAARAAVLESGQD